MLRPDCKKLSAPQAARIESRRKALDLTNADLLARFSAALVKDGRGHSLESAKMRLSRALSPRMRRPVSEETKKALAKALEWTLEEFDRHVLGKMEMKSNMAKSNAGKNGDAPVDLSVQLSSIARELQHQARRLESIARALKRQTKSRG